MDLENVTMGNVVQRKKRKKKERTDRNSLLLEQLPTAISLSFFFKISGERNELFLILDYTEGKEKWVCDNFSSSSNLLCSKLCKSIEEAENGGGIW